MPNSTSSQFQSLLFACSLFLLAATFLLIIAGGLVTSHEAGLAVPDWPLSYGQLMPPMVGNIFWEHGHRMIAGAVGILTLIFACLIQKFETRPWLKKLGWIAFGAVVLQAVLGGLTVLYLLPAPISIFHACLAQTFFCLVAGISYFLNPVLPMSSPNGSTPRFSLVALSEAERVGDPKTLDSRFRGNDKNMVLLTSILIYLQLIFGATVRHTGHFVVPHMIVACLVLVAVARLSVGAGPSFGGKPAPTVILGFLTVLQFFLGIGAFIFTKSLERAYAPAQWEVLFTAAHQSNGALILAISILLTLMLWR